MIKFLRKLWPYVRPYQTRLFLGLVCGILYAALNGTILAGIRIIIDVVFGSSMTTTPVASGGIPDEAQKFLDYLKSLLPNAQSSSKTDQLLLIATIPVVMLVRAVFGYLSVYLTNWAAARAIANIRTKLFN